MGWLLALCQYIFILMMLGIIALFLFHLLLSWAWAQQNREPIDFAGFFSTGAIEWGAMVVLHACRLFKARPFYETPPLRYEAASQFQFPIVFVPSLHSGPGIFRILVWRLKKHFYSSLWPFSWRPFLQSSVLLEDELAQYLIQLLKKTESTNFRIISFGTSRPIVGRVLERPELKGRCDHWIAISAPAQLSPTLRFLSTARLKSVFTDETSPMMQPHLLIRGSSDTFCYPDDVWNHEKQLIISPAGHYASLLHPTTVQTVLEELK